MDFSQRADAAATFVLSMAQQNHARVTLLHVIQPAPPIYGAMNAVYPETSDYREIQGILHKRLGDFAARELPKIEVLLAVEIGDPASAIIHYADDHAADLIAMPTHGYGTFRRMLLGSVTAKVLHDARVAVWTSAHAPEPSHRAHPLPRHIVVALDLQPHSQRTVALALELAQNTGADLELLHIAREGETATSAAEEKVEMVLEEAVREQSENVLLESTKESEVMLTGGSVASQVRSMALRKRADLVIIGHGHTHTGLISRLKTVSYSIVREAPCPVISF